MVAGLVADLLRETDSSAALLQLNARQTGERGSSAPLQRDARQKRRRGGEFGLCLGLGISPNDPG